MKDTGVSQGDAVIAGVTWLEVIFSSIWANNILLLFLFSN